MMNPRIAVGALALGAALLVPNTALAGGKAAGRKKAQTIELARPANAPDANAAGTVKITQGKSGDQTVLDLTHLNARTTYEVHDSATGRVIGTVRTNRKGHATFDLSKNARKAASVNGADASGVSSVDVVDPATGDTVLTGDVQVPPAVPQIGYADFEDDAGDSADVFLSSDPDAGSDSFTLSFFPVPDESASTFPYYDLNLDTSNGDNLPLGASSVTELAGREFQIVGPDGKVVIDDTLPALEDATDSEGYDDGSTGDWSGDWGGNWGGDWSGGYDWTAGDFTQQFATTSGCPNHSSDAAASKNHSKAKRARRHRHGKADAAPAGFTLKIADANGDLQDAGKLVEETADTGGDFGGDWGNGDFGNGGFFIGIVPFGGSFDGTQNGSFDLGSLFDKLFGGNFGGGSFDPFGGSASNTAGTASKNRHR